MQTTLSFCATVLHKDFAGFCNEKLQEIGLSQGLLYFVIYVGKRPGSAPGQLARALRLDAGYVQRSTEKLVADGFLRKEKDPRDRRAYILSLTDKGQRAFALSHRLFADWDARVLEKLPEEEQKQLLSLLGKLAGKGGSQMNYSIVYSSQTGNTEQLAMTLREALPREDCVYCGPPDEGALAAPLLFVGFWTDKGSCDQAAAGFLEALRDKKVFLFGTAGFGGSPEYFGKILDTAKKLLDGSVTLAGEYMCQGKMPDSVGRRYEKMAEASAPHARELLENFHSAASHPNAEDLLRIKTAACGAFAPKTCEEKKSC